MLLKTQDGLLQTIGHELRSIGPRLVPLLDTRCLHLGAYGVGVHLTKHQLDLQADDMSCWPALVPLLTTRCCTGSEGIRGCRGIGGYTWKMKTVYWKLLMKTQDSLLQAIEHELRSIWPKLIPLLATKCLYLGAYGVGVHLTKHQPHPQADDMSCWHVVVPLLTTRCLYCSSSVRGTDRGVGGIGGLPMKMETVYWKVILKTQDGLLQTIEHELRSMGPKLVPLLATRCLYLEAVRGIWGWWEGAFNKTSAWPTGWWHVMLTCISTNLDH